MFKKYYLLIFSLCTLVLALVIFRAFVDQNTGKKIFLKWKIYSEYPDTNPIFKEAMEKFIYDIKTMTDEQINIDYIPSGEEKSNEQYKVFDAVSSGAVEMGFGISRFWAADKIPGSDFWYTIPFGLNAREMYAWLNQGGGLELFQKIYKPFNVVPFPIGDTGGAMGGWFRKEIRKIEDIKGLRIRDSGLPAKVWEKLNATTNPTLPGTEFLDSYKNNGIDAIVGLGPFHDEKYGFHKGPKYYYYPGWQEPCGILLLIINKTKWDQLPGNFKKIIEIACDKTYHYMLDRFNNSNSADLLELQKQGVKFMEFPPVILNKFRELTNEALEEEVNKNAQFAEIYRSYKIFKENIVDSGWEKIVEEAVYSETTVLNFIKELEQANFEVVEKIYKKGNKKVVISLNNKDINKEITAIAKIINDYSISIRSIMVECHPEKGNDWEITMNRAKTVADMLDGNDGEKNESLTKKIFYGDTTQIDENKSPGKVEIVIEF